METVRIVLSFVEAVAFLIVLSIAAIMFVKRERPKPPCDTCEHLIIKRKTNLGPDRYFCTVRQGFETPPEYCREYRQRKGGGQDDA